MWYALSILLVGYLPGALVFRLPIADRSRRAALPAEERVFWGVLLSVCLSSVAALGLAAAASYQFERVLWINGIVSVLAVVLARTRLRLGASTPYPTWTALLPIGLVALGLWVNYRVPPSEYVMGGKDPGVYMNEGIQIAQRGTLVMSDEAVSSIPAPYRPLFFASPPRGVTGYVGIRFMGFFLLNPDQGTVVGQFPHLYPSWIAMAYGVNGLSGARWILGLWAVLGLLAVYFVGVRIMGRPAAAAGAGLLAVHVVQVWYARYPNAEMVMQPLVFAGLLAYARAQVDGDRFFAPVAGLMLALGAFDHLTALFVIAAIAGAAIIGRFDGQHLRTSFTISLVAGTTLAVAYLMVFLSPYFATPLRFLRFLVPMQEALLALLGVAVILLWRGARQPAVARQVRRWLPAALVALLWLGATYAYFFRHAAGLLAAHDADALRTFTSFYLTPYGLVAALAGFAIVARRSFWASAPFLILVAMFSFLFFYKIRIVPEHFWAARRFLAVILPGALLLVGAAAFSDVPVDARGRFAWINARAFRLGRYALGVVLVALLGRHFLGATQPILRHVEYAGLIPRLEQLSATFGDDDLVLVESRGSSDVHVLGLPLTYIYGRNLLVFAATAPNKQMFREFLLWARGRYRRVFFVGGGGTELLSRSMAVKAIGGERFQIPEYESTLNAYPGRVTFKEFDFGIYEFLPGPVDPVGFDLDVGASDDLYVRRFHAKERRPSGASFRWTRNVSHVSIVGTRAEHQEVTLWMGDGGRPPSAEPADVAVSLNGRVIGAVTVRPGLEPYRFAVPPDLAAEIAVNEDAAHLQLTSRTWNPAVVLGGGDTRDLGVLVDRIEMK